MTHSKLAPQSIHRAPVGKRMLQGAAIGLVLISIFLLTLDETNPAWPRFWMIRPLVIVPVAGAIGGVGYFFMDHLRFQGGWKMVLAHFISLVGFIVCLWLGTVLGLDGTLWD